MEHPKQDSAQPSEELICVPANRSRAEDWFESFLWNSRFIVLFAVVASLLMAFGIFYVTSIDVYYTLSHLSHYAQLDDAARADLKAKTVAHVVGSVDGFLLGTIMLIFSLGLYELFISKIDAAEGNKTSSKILMIHSLDDLKDKLAKVILMILVVMFFEQALFLKPTAPLELLYYSLAIMLVALALYLSHKAYQH
ncbi:YqhA family protein [Hydrogenovibrio sp. JE_KL2]|uniref:YqhA family protein n=1 Tax=Hydrogenovibrio sp. JE_KL2 TaxID=2651188 RepID=UPI00128BC0ED|nr:YqhA family protein [Hydrogenovibrio sp. JE_KL2]MPQ76727.1 YqhA family protein [Hydrogenovibrio sp. JE_KL2]